MKKIQKGWIYRVMFFLGLIVLAELFLYHSVAISVNSHLPFSAFELSEASCNPDNSVVVNLIANKEFEFNNILDKLEDKLENLDVKLFKNFLQFNIFIENDMKAETEEKKIKFNIELEKYIEAISGSEKEFLFRKSLSGLRKLKLQDLSYSFRPVDESMATTAFIKDNEDIKMHIELSKFNYIWFLLISIPISWGILLLIDSIIKFILFGKPFIEKIDVK